MFNPTRITVAIQVLVLMGCIAYSCTKTVGINPDLAFNDKALYDSCQNLQAFTYYHNDPSATYAGTNGPHGAFKLRFNKVAALALTDNGKLPVNAKFPDGSMIVKEANTSGIYALMYKRKGAWLWAELFQNGSGASYSVGKDPTVCTSCHNQTGHRDLVVSFHFY